MSRRIGLLILFGAASAHADAEVKKTVRALKAATADAERTALVAVLRKIGPRRAYTRLQDVLKAKSVPNRRAAAQQLAEWAEGYDRPPGSPGPLARALKDTDTWTRRHLVRALSRYREKAVPPLLKMLGHRHAATRAAAGEALAAQSPGVVVPKLIAMLDGDHERARIGALRALGWFDDPTGAAFARIEAGLVAADPDLRAAAVFALRGQRARRKEALARLSALLRETDVRVSVAALQSTAHHGPAGHALLVGALGETPEATEVGIQILLLGLGEAALEPLIASMTTGTARHRAGVARVLGAYGRDHGYSSVARALKSGLRHEDAAVRRASVRALRSIAPDAARLAVQDVARVAADPDPGVRAAALFTLARIAPGPRPLLELSERATKHADARVRAAGEHALYRLRRRKSEAATAAIAKVLKQPDLDAAARADCLSMLASITGGARIVLADARDLLVKTSGSLRLRAEAVHAVGEAIANRSGRLDELRLRYREDEDVALAVRNGLAWLVKQQVPGTGAWPAKPLGADRGWDVGITALATLALLGAGRADEPVRAGLAYLADQQKASGEINRFSSRGAYHMVEHAWATLALVEAAALIPDERWRPLAQKAVRYCEQARNPEMAWRYKARGGRNDSHVSTLMVQALRMAAWTGLDVDKKAWQGPRDWFDKMTEPNFGQVGYNYPGGDVFRTDNKNQAARFPPAKSLAMTGAGMWSRMLLGEDPATNRMLRNGAKLCVGLRPKWLHDGSIDLYFWHFGTLALAQVGGELGDEWWAATKRTLIDHQDVNGSWAPVGAWGDWGGRGYSTAMGALTLLAPTRYPNWTALRRLPPAMEDARLLLDDLARLSESRLVAAAARRALARIASTLD